MILQNSMESLCLFIKVLREKEKYKTSYILATTILKNLSDLQKDLPDETKINLLYELSISCFYNGKIEEGSSISDSCILNRNFPGTLKNSIISNLRFYLTKLDVLESFHVPVVLPLIDSNPEKLWRALNPSITQYQNGYLINCRCVNYIQESTSYTSQEPDGVIRTRNFLIQCDTNFKAISQHEVTEGNNQYLQYLSYPKRIQGYEDCRMIMFCDKLYMFSVCFHLTKEWLPQIGLLEVNLETGSIEGVKHIPGLIHNRCEKNWSPFCITGDSNFIYIVYLCDPFCILKIHPSMSKCEIHKIYQTQLDFTRFRGSAPPIPFDGGYLMIIHEVIFYENNQRMYIHRFIWFKIEDQPIKKISHAFYLKEMGIEFCSGMCYSQENENYIYITAGLKDKEAYVFKCESDTIRKSLKCINL